tara:strand:+ start:1022 stop:1276 length:255 start_codon:yes stop_codon:yes gene_type:complete
MIYACDADAIFRVAYIAHGLPQKLDERIYHLFLKLGQGDDFKQFILAKDPVNAQRVAMEFCRGMKTILDAGMAFYDQQPRTKRL